jgi:hypothetical protein
MEDEIENEVNSLKIQVYGEISAETFGKVENFTYLCSIYEEYNGDKN